VCIVAFAWKAHPEWQLVAIGNRDELHARPAQAAHRWEDAEHLLAGKDTLAGGTWLGISEQGRFAVVTNLYGFGPPVPERASRGDLLKDFLSGDGRYADIGAAEYSDFNPFNLITVAGGEALVHSNRPDKSTNILDHGIHGLSNGTIDQPWPKSPRLNGALETWMAKESNDPAMLFDILLDQNSFERGDRSNTPPQPEHSPIFISNPTYGTRCSTVVTIDHNGNGVFTERRFAPSGSAIGETRLSFSWPSAG
jgi:uncharacterized protein with NRDE domain